MRSVDPVPVPDNAADPARAASGDIVRAEFPPAQYWRKWCGDAPAAVFPDQAAEAAAPPAELPARPPQAPVAVDGEPPFRVLVVEDDPSQALFAESVLNGTGMVARVVSVAGEMMQALEAFHPDLVLMDLHMPGMSGTELTGLIRAHASFGHMPVVFLTGDSDPETQVEVLESGADDVLHKPVRPRHLVAAVSSRIRRARAMRASSVAEGRHPVTGLHTRMGMLHRLGAAIPSGQAGALFFVEIENTAALRDRFGYAALEEVLSEAGRKVAELAADGAAAARLNDSSFLLHAPALSSDGLMDWARRLRDGLGQHPVVVDGQPLRLRALVGYVSLEHPFIDASAALSAAEQALRQARALPVGIAAYAPPAPAEVERLDAFSEELKLALAEKRFELAFQPIVAVAGGDQAQYQTLLRMRDSRGQVHTAATIVPAAEAAGLMHEIDGRVLQHAADVLRRRNAEHSPVRLFVSQSPRTLARDGYAQWLLETLRGSGIEGGTLVVDVRQDEALVDVVALHEFCALMVPAGVQLCLSQYQSSDDADTLLARLPLGYVRLSGRYATGLSDLAVRDEMRAAIDRAHRLGLQVIGQHVEDPQAAATLWMSGIDFIQGNLVQGVADGLDFDFQHSVL